ncbi:MAG: outer membrane protein transport protein, partial [Bacteroidia bacterium]|nr:outer membrane protein transport protein [Bacteroidia bacterium]
KETDNKPASSKDIKSISLNQYIKTNGTGLGARIGIIGKLNESIRIGYSFQSPVSHTLKDIYSYQIDATFDPGASYNSGPAVSPATSKSQQNNYSYRISTPSRNTLSIALLDKKIGFLSGDVEFVNYKQAKLSPVVQGDNFNDDNKLIKTIYKNAVNLRVGAEIISDIFRFRAGFAYYPSPFENSKIPYISGLDAKTYTLGFGIREKKYALDIAYVTTKKADYYAPYTLNNSNNYYFATNNLRAGNVVITATFNLE